MTQKLKGQNKIRCICCGQEATSTHRHDYVRLENCRNGSAVDGGDDYCKIAGKDLSLVETWNPVKQEWNLSTNDLMRDIAAGKYDFPKFSNNKSFDFMDYLKKKEEAEKGLKEAFFQKFNLTENEKADSFWWKVWHMPLNDERDPDPRDVYFNFIHFVDLILPRR